MTDGQATTGLGQNDLFCSTIIQLNRAVFSTRNRETLFDNLCSIATEYGKFRLAWIGLINEQNQSLSPVAVSGKDAGQLQHINISLTGDQQDPVYRAIRTKQSVVTRDSLETILLPIRNDHDLTGDSWSSASIPIRYDNSVVGVFILLSGEPDFFNTHRITLLESVVFDISSALERFAREDQQQQTEKRLRRSETQLKEAQRIGHVGSWEFDFITDTMHWSDEVYRMFLLKPQQFPATYDAFFKILHPDDKAAITPAYTNFIRNKTPYDVTHRVLLRDGTIKYIHARCETVQDESGNPVCAYGTILDITDEQRQHDRINHLTLIRTTMLAVHRLLVQIPDTNHLLQEICEVFVGKQGYRSCWITLLDHNRRFVMTAKASPTYDFQQLTQNINEGKPPDCIHKVRERGKFDWITDHLTCCKGCPLVDNSLKNGCMTVPIQFGEHFYGALNVILPEQLASDPEEQELLENIAGDIGFSLFNREQETKRRRHEREIYFRDRISRAFALHQGNDLFGRVLDIILEALESKSGMFGFLAGSSLIFPPLSCTLIDQAPENNGRLALSENEWPDTWKEALEHKTAVVSNAPFSLSSTDQVMKNSLVTGIVSGERVIGLLQVADKDGDYDKHNKRLLEKLATAIAPILAARLDSQRAELRFREVLEDLPLLICRNHPDGEVIFANNTYGTYFGVDPLQMRGNDFWALIPVEDRNKVRENLARLDSDTPLMTHEHRVIRADGKIRTMRWTNKLISEDGKQVLQAWGEDVTDQRLMESQLFVSEKMAIIAGLAAGVAHEINTPLSAILQSIQMIELGLDPGQEQSRSAAEVYGIDLAQVQQYLHDKELNFFLSAIRESVSRAARIVSDLLHFSRPQSREPVFTDISELIDRAVELAKTDYSMKKEFNILNVSFIRQYDPELPQVNCVPMEIEEVLINLIKNSCQAMAEDPSLTRAKIFLTTRRDNDSIVIEVSDNGPGMEQDVLRCVFDPFFTTKDVGKGTGLGLSVSYSIVCDKHGGTMKVKSRPGHGAAFTITLPVNGPGRQTNLHTKQAN